ncbi:MAG TPA: autoinducer 2 import system permease LsrD, partial [Candidatus Angelobacter sp.]|nr:autoinducer 2 import system permease LsrD [Candidatus Angelobacter sp.]
MKKRLLRWEGFLFLCILLELIIFGSINSSFLNFTDILYSMNDYMYVGIAAIPMTLVMVSGGIDVSVGSIMGLASIVLGVSWTHGVNVWLAVLVALVVCCVAGLFNGVIISFTKIQPLVITLGSLFLFSGIALVISGGGKASGYEGISGLPNGFIGLANNSVLGIPNLVLIFLLFISLGTFLLHFTKFGRKVFLVGINNEAAKFSGLKTRSIMLLTYIIAGFGGGVAGVLLTSYFSSARSDLGSDAILPIITAVVLGGTSIYGGKGSVIGTALASIVIGMLEYGLQLVGMSS